MSLSLKERKVNTGATNLTARSERGSIIRKDFYRSWTHKLISPEAHVAPAQAVDQGRTYNKTATWRPVALYERNFTTTTSESFQDPSTQKAPEEPHAKSEEELTSERKARGKQVEAVEAFCKTAKAHFGTTAAMLKAFNKKGEDNLTLHELNEYLKRNKIDHHVSHEERQRIFDYVREGNNGQVGVNELLRKTEEQEFRDEDHANNMFKIRNFLKEHLLRLRAEREKRQHRDPDLEHRKKTKGVRGEKALIRQALGQKTFDIEMDHDELHETIEHLHHVEKPKDVEHKKFLRFLRHSNLNLATIPFYDMRHEDLENLKARAARIDRAYEDPAVFGRMMELAQTRWSSSLATTNEVDPDTMHRKHEAILEGRATMESRLHLTRSLPNLHTTGAAGVRPSPLSVLTAEGGSERTNASSAAPSSSLAPSASESSLGMGGAANVRSGRNLAPLSPALNRSARSMPSLHEPSSATSPVSLANSSFSNTRKVMPKPRNLLHNSEGVNADEVSASNSNYIGTVDSDEKNPIRHTNALKLKKEIFVEQEQSQQSDFYAQIVSDSASMGKVKDASKVMRVEKIDAHAYLPSGKRAMHSGPTDWSRVGVGGTNGADSGYGRNEDDPFLTTNAKYYPPLIYKPSQPVGRDLVSESEINFRKKEFQRAERYARLKANTEVTRVRLEYEEVEKEVRSLRRDHGRLEDKIRYQTAMFLNDLKGYKAQPLVRMAKKQNIHLSDRMWNGNAEHHIPENRDFTSTYTASYDANNLRLSDTLIHPPTGNGVHE